MITIFIKHFFIYVHYFIINNYLRNSKKCFYPTFLIIILETCILALLTTVCCKYIPLVSYFIPVILLELLNYASNSSPRLSLSFTLISFTLSYSLFVFISLILTTFLAPINYPTKHDNRIALYFFVGIIQFCCISLFKKLKRFSHGMSYLYSQKFVNLGSNIGLIFIILITLTHLISSPSLLFQGLITIFIPILLFILLHWWQSQLTKAYRKRLAQLELESLRTELEQKTALLKKLETKNEEMGRLIHKDNKLIPAMEHAVSSYLASAFTDIALQQAQGEALLSDLKEFSEARRGILSTFAPISAPKYNTGIPSLDAILVYMYQKAQVQDIRFYAAATPESIAALPPALTTKKLVHMLSDLLENAIIATKTSTEKQIQVQIYLANGLFTIEVADTGCSFEPATLISFGLEKASTHLTEGGSGIGLLDIWKIKEETKASIHIHEYEAGAPFSKKLFITFDKKNKYVIHTWRDKELSPLVNRGDIVILPQEQV